jgi:HSP20 family protein
MVLRRWDPFYELRQWNLLHRDMDRLGGVSYTTLEDNPEVESWPIPLDVVHEYDHIVVQASMPGVDPEDI